MSRDVDTSAANANVFLYGNRDITLDAGSIKAGTGTVTLVAATRNISEAGVGTGVIMAGALQARAAAGAVTLDRVNNVGAVAGVAGGAFTYRDADLVDLGPVTAKDSVHPTAGNLVPPDGTTATNGITAGGQVAVTTQSGGNGDITLSRNATGANVFLYADKNVTLNTGSITAGTGVVTLTAKTGNITEAGTGVITGGALQVNAGGAVLLDNGNNVATIAGAVGGTYTYRDADSVDIGAVTATDTVHALSTSTAGITTPGKQVAVTTVSQDITLSQDVKTTGGNVFLYGNRTISLNAGNITTGTGIVTLSTITGDIAEAGAGVITGAALQANAGGSVTLENVNKFSTMAGAAGGTFTYKNAGSVDIGSVSATDTVHAKTTATNGITINNGSVAVTTLLGGAGDITLSKNVQTNGGNIILTADGNITLTDGSINAGAGTVTLTATTGGVNETDGKSGAVSAKELLVNAVKNSKLNNSGNDVVTVAAKLTGLGQSFEYTDTNSVDIGTVATISGITTNNDGVTAAGNITVTSKAGDITLSKDANTSNGGSAPLSGATVTLDAAATGMVQENGGAVVADNLLVKAVTTSTLTTATNDVNTVAAKLTGPGQSFNYTDANKVDIGTVAAIDGITTNNNSTTTGGNITVTSKAGDIVLIRDINTSNGGATPILGTSVTLDASLKGKVVENGGKVVTDKLLVLAAMSSALKSLDNDVETITAKITDSGESFIYVDKNNVNIGEFDAANKGIVTHGGAVSVNSVGGNLTVRQAIITTPTAANSAGGTVVLEAATGLTTETAGTITTTGNGNGSGGEVLLSNLTSGDITLHGDLTATGAGSGEGAVVTAINGGNTIVLDAKLDVSRGAAGANDGTIQFKAGGDITDTAKGYLVANTNGLVNAVSTGGKIVLDRDNVLTTDGHSVANISLETTSNAAADRRIVFHDADGLNITAATAKGALTTPAGIAATSVGNRAQGLKTMASETNGDIAVVANGNLTIAKDTHVSATTGTINLTAVAQSNLTLPKDANVSATTGASNPTTTDGNNIFNYGTIQTAGNATLSTNGTGTIDGGTIQGNKVSLNASYIGGSAKPFVLANLIAVDVTSANASRVAANMEGPNIIPQFQITAPGGLVLYNGYAVGGTGASSFLDTRNAIAAEISYSYNERQMDYMMMLASFEEFFTVVPKESIMDVEEEMRGSARQEIVKGRLPDGSPYQRIQDIKK